MESRPLRLAAHVSEAWNEICWKQDAEFLDLVSKLIKVPVLELRELLEQSVEEGVEIWKPRLV